MALALLAVALLAPTAVVAQASGSISGIVADAQSGLPLPGVTVQLVGTSLAAQTQAQGRFTIDGIARGTYRLQMTRSGYQSTLSSGILVEDGQVSSVTLSVNPTLNAESTAVIGRSSTRASSSLQQSSTIARSVSTETLAQSGIYRAGDALRELPGIFNSITGDTGALGDDIPLDIRGLGAAETVTTLDGHPIAGGASGGYNFQVSPLVGIRSYDVIYGTGGADQLGVNAIGGVIDIRTIDPSAVPSFSFTQGYGTYNQLATIVQGTGTAGRFGYAAAAGVYGLDGPIRYSSTYAPVTSWDPSSSAPAIVGAASYVTDSSAISRTGMAKLRYELSPATSAGFTLYSTSYWENKTGNGDQDYQTYAYGLAQGNKLLGGKSKIDPCPSGMFQAKNSSGVPWGTGPNGLPDGGAPDGCVTPAQYATYETGPAGAGSAYQTLNLNDEAFNLTSASSNRALTFDLYTNRYLVETSRQNGLPNWFGTPVNGTTTFPYVQIYGLGTYRHSLYMTSGGQAAEAFYGRDNDLTLGVVYNNASDSLTSYSAGVPAVGNSNAYYVGPFFRDTYRIPTANLTLYANAYFLHGSATNSSFVNPRLTAVYLPDAHTVVRASFGASTTEPTANYLNQPFVPTNAALGLIGAGGGGTPNCSSFSVGTAPSSILQPERGVDEELALGHRFFRDTQLEGALFNENVYNKIFSNISVPIDLQSPPFPISPTIVSALTTALEAKCGVGGYNTAITETANLGQLRSQGFVIDGRARFSRQVFTDFSYAVTSTVLVNGVTQLLQQNVTLIPGSQLPRVPLQQVSVALDALLFAKVEGRFTYYGVSGNNTKALPPYDYSNFSLLSPVGPGTLSLTISNLFNQWSDNYSLENGGVPLALNQYATAAQYATQIGNAATELLALPPRTVFVNYTLSVR